MQPPLDKLPLALLATALYFYLGAAFQVGYFVNVGPEFLSLVTPGEWLFSFGVMFGPIVIMLPMLFGIFAFCIRALEKELYSDRLADYINVIPAVIWRFIGYCLFLLFIFIALIFSDYWIAIMVGFTLIAAVIEITFIKYFWERHGLIHWNHLGSLLATIGILLYCSGYAYAQHFAGRKCSIATKEGKFEKGLFLRFVGEGYLIRLGERVFFVPKDQVTEIVCGKWEVK